MPIRQQISDSQRRQLRFWASSQSKKPSIQACRQWWQLQFHHSIGAASIHHILSPSFIYLDSSLSNTSSSSSIRHREAKWPILEQILWEFQRQIEDSGGVTSEDILCAKAHQIWSQLPEYSNLPRPEFSTGWVDNFKKRHGIKYRIRHGEAASVPSRAHEEITTLHLLCAQYVNKADVYNMDESGLFWQQNPSIGLLSQLVSGTKIKKERLSLVFACNATGIDRLPLWVIGKARTPRALQRVNLRSLNIIWRFNKTAWMKTNIMIEWLRAFYIHVGRERNILLLMDNLKAHAAAVTAMPPPTNVRIEYLPANATSVYQPLDQGIIRSFKSHYKKLWLQYIMDCFTYGGDPFKTVTVLDALRWSRQAWENEIANEVIQNCFRKSTVFHQIDQQPQPLPTELRSLYIAICNRTSEDITLAMDLSNFIEPLDENEPPEQTEVDLDSIISDFTQSDIIEEEEQQQPPPPPPPTTSEARDAADTLIRYFLGQEDSCIEQIRTIERVERYLKAVPRRQINLDSWIEQNSSCI